MTLFVTSTPIVDQSEIPNRTGKENSEFDNLMDAIEKAKEIAAEHQEATVEIILVYG